MDAFISYSHRDTAALDRLHVHLAVLRREGLIHEWFDRDILAGDNLDLEIAKRLETSGLFLLLVTPDFLNSDYCVEKEMARAMERQAAGEARVIAVIVEPSDWQSTNLRAIKVVPQDGRAINEWTNSNSAYLNVVQEIRRAIEADQRQQPYTPRNSTPSSMESRPRYRAKRDFDDIDRSEFRLTTFNQMRDYFRSAVTELDSLDDFRARFSETSGTSFGCTIVNRARDRVLPISRCIQERAAGQAWATCTGPSKKMLLKMEPTVGFPLSRMNLNYTCNRVNSIQLGVEIAHA